MKLKNILIAGMAAMALTACNDFLDVEPSSTSADAETVYSSESEIDNALNGVYASILSDNLFGSNLYTTFQLNSDVDFSANSNEAATGSSPARFDVRTDNGNVEKLWNALYSSIETANWFVYNLGKSSLYSEGLTSEATNDEEGRVVTKQVPNVTSLTQKMGEAKVIRAMCYHELLSYYGDVPFTFQATYETDNLLPPVTDRQAISDSLINDLKHAAEYMYSDQDAGISAPERISKEAAYAMIARLALQAGGYSLNHDANDTKSYKMTRPSNYKSYYQIARDYAKKVIDAGGHSLKNSYRQVFVDECNFITNTGDDPIFEIPFAKNSSGAWGYQQGPTNGVDTEDETEYTNTAWGATKGNSRTTAFYRYQFDEKDLRRDFIVGFWYYSNQGLPTLRIDYAMHNNKWSKLWNTTGLGKSTTGATGINFAYIRYADVLLMFAEAENEINGPTEDAKNALKEVRNRAFAAEDRAEKVEAYVENASASKEDFLDAVLDERKFEFAGENMRWKDLVRNNRYAETLMYTFLAYYSIAENQAGSAPYMDMVEEHDGIAYSQLFADDVFYTYVKNTNDANFPNSNVYMMYIVNPYSPSQIPQVKPQTYFEQNGLNYEAVSARSITGLTSSSSSVAWQTQSIAWQNDGTLKGQVLYSLFGYIRGDEYGNIKVVDNGSAVNFNILPSDAAGAVSRLPAVRYLLPYPAEIIARSSGAYQNYYGY